MVSLPFTENLRSLGDNEDVVRSRFRSFLALARKDKAFLAEVDKETSKCISEGYAEPAEPRSPSEPAHYLPIVEVARKSQGQESVPKVRIVKDANAALVPQGGQTKRP